MKYLKLISFLCFFTLTFYSAVACADPIIVDHTSIVRFSSLTDTEIDAVQSNFRWHYAHTSHGSQLTTGLSRLEDGDPRLDVARGSRYLPTVSSALNIFDGQEHDTYITPDEYWESTGGIQYTRNVLNNNPTINVSAWSWCCQADYYSDAQIQEYLDAMTAFELEFPDVTFVYLTGNAQGTASNGYRRFLHNNMIREWVSESDNRVLFDFAELDSWWLNGSQWEQATYDHWNGREWVSVPVEHPQFDGNAAGHTTYESCEQKGKAVWLMFDEIHKAGQVPLPGALWLLGSGFVFVLGMRKRGRR